MSLTDVFIQTSYINLLSNLKRQKIRTNNKYDQQNTNLNEDTFTAKQCSITNKDTHNKNI